MRNIYFNSIHINNINIFMCFFRKDINNFISNTSNFFTNDHLYHLLLTSTIKNANDHEALLKLFIVFFVFILKLLTICNYL